MRSTVVTIRASDADDPDSGSSLIEFHISAGNDEEAFTVETDGKGVGHLVIAKVLSSLTLPHTHTHINYANDFCTYLIKQTLFFIDSRLCIVRVRKTLINSLSLLQPLDFESFPTYKLQIDARNPEPLMKGLEYGSDSTAFVSVSVTDVDEAPEFSLDILDVTVPENTTKGSVLLTVEAKDPEGKEIR